MIIIQVILKNSNMLNFNLNWQSFLILLSIKLHIFPFLFNWRSFKKIHTTSVLQSCPRCIYEKCRCIFCRIILHHECLRVLYDRLSLLEKSDFNSTDASWLHFWSTLSTTSLSETSFGIILTLDRRSAVNCIWFVNRLISHQLIEECQCMIMLVLFLNTFVSRSLLRTYVMKIKWFRSDLKSNAYRLQSFLWRTIRNQ